MTRYAPRYMEEMESIFDQSQEEERKRTSFLKQAFLSIYTHLDVANNERCVGRVMLYWSNLSFCPFQYTRNEQIIQVLSLSLCVSIKAVYNELHNTLMSISEQEDLHWWKNSHGPGMPTDWPQFQVNTHVVRIVGILGKYDQRRL